MMALFTNLLYTHPIHWYTHPMHWSREVGFYCAPTTHCFLFIQLKKSAECWPLFALR